MNNYNYKSIFVVMGSLLLTMTMQAQEVAESAASDQNIMSFLFENIILLIGIVVFLAGMLAIYNMSAKLLELQRLRTLAELGVTSQEDIITVTKESSWERLMTWASGLKPMAKESSIDLGHDYDGIRELDNSLPPWWLGIMYGSILFAVVYMWYYHWSGNEWSSEKEYAAEMEAGNEIKEAFLFKMANLVNENTVEALTDEADLAAGLSIYNMNCVACHGPQGQGSVGPNLTDDYWIHGGSIKNIFATIKNGVPEKGMIAWKAQLKPKDMQQVASYIQTLVGTNPPNPKDPEGQLYEE